jgi:general secretion pathway protein D
MALMRAAVLSAILLFSLMCFCQDPAPSAPPKCVDSSCPAEVSKADQKQAREQYKKAQELERKGKLEEALEAARQANHLVPQDPAYATKAEILRQALVTQHVRQGNTLLVSGQREQAAKEFRRALELDPESNVAVQQLRESQPRIPRSSFANITFTDESRPIVLSPNPGRFDFHIRGTSRDAIEQVAQKFGVKVTFDDSVQSRPVRIDLDSVDFFSAMHALSDATKTFWVAFSADQVIILQDTPEQHRNFDQMTMRTFYLSDVTSQQELQDMVNTLRTIFNIKFITSQQGTGTITVRGQDSALEAATRFLDSFDMKRPQVLLDIQVFDVSRTFARALGVNWPLQFQAINVGAAALAALGSGQNLQSLISQLISGGGINQANSTAISALLAQAQNSTLSQLLTTPFVTFGGGKTLFAVPVPGTTVSFSLNQSDIRELDHLTLRASQSLPATMRIGSRYPILNASYSPIYASPAITQSLANGSYVAPFPSFSYEDLGISLKATPQIQDDSSVSLKFELQIRTLTAQSFNGVPVIANREYSGNLTLKDGDSGLVAGFISKQEVHTLTGIPGLASVPGLNYAASSIEKDEQDDDLLIVVTPYVLSTPTRGNNEIWLAPHATGQ